MSIYYVRTYVRRYARACTAEPTNKPGGHTPTPGRLGDFGSVMHGALERVQCNGPTNQRTEELKETGRRASNALVGIAAAGAFGRGRRGRGFAFGGPPARVANW
jgi:hypothetical protein